jgi:hypothetical protein
MQLAHGRLFKPFRQNDKNFFSSVSGLTQTLDPLELSLSLTLTLSLTPFHCHSFTQTFVFSLYLSIVELPLRRSSIPRRTNFIQNTSTLSLFLSINNYNTSLVYPSPPNKLARTNQKFSFSYFSDKLFVCVPSW